MKTQKTASHILWISPYAPYDSVNHAGGQDFNHFLKYLNQKQLFHIHVATLCLKSETAKLDFESYGIPYSCHVVNKSKIIYHLGLLLDRLSSYNPLHYCGCLLSPYTRLCFQSLLRKVQKSCPAPDIIIFHWTQAALLMPKLKKMYPHAVCLMLEVDVAYLGYQRIWQKSLTARSKFLWEQKYRHLKAAELSCIRQAEQVIVLNQKDADLLTEDNIPQEKIFVSVPYYHDYSSAPRRRKNLNILFFGYMAREENHLSALWFIQNVMPLLPEDYHFVVIGTEPREELLQLQNDNIHVLGYVENVIPYFQDSLCLAAPLVLGAGIKIKILEGLSAGIPVLTNAIGIEGIHARNREEFFFCEAPDEYADAIRQLSDEALSCRISENARKFIRENFNTDKRLDELISALLMP